MKAPIAYDLYCGLGGWAEGFLANGYTVIGFDNHRHVYGDQKYPGQLVLQDALTIHGSQLRDGAVIVASPPCQDYSYLAMPWSRSVDIVRPCGDGWEILNSAAAKEMRAEWEHEGPDNRLFDACFRIQREAIEATRRQCISCGGGGVQDFPFDDRDCIVCEGRGYFERYIPLIVENVRGAIPWVGRSAWNYGSFHLWGDVPALMPINLKRGGVKVSGLNWSNYGKPDYKAEAFNGTAEKRLLEEDGRKNTGGSWFNIGSPNQKVTNQNPVHDAVKQGAGNGDWFSKEARDGGSSAALGSKSAARKAASAQIAKIPLPLADHIARTFKPRVEAVA